MDLLSYIPIDFRRQEQRRYLVHHCGYCVVRASPSSCCAGSAQPRDDVRTGLQRVVGANGPDSFLIGILGTHKSPVYEEGSVFSGNQLGVSGPHHFRLLGVGIDIRTEWDIRVLPGGNQRLHHFDCWYAHRRADQVEYRTRDFHGWVLMGHYVSQ